MLDIDLPQNESFKLLKLIKQAAIFTPVIILSAHTDGYVLRQCKLMGADYYFDKYHEFEKIAGIINSIYSKINLK